MQSTHEKKKYVSFQLPILITRIYNTFQVKVRVFNKRKMKTIRAICGCFLFA